MNNFERVGEYRDADFAVQQALINAADYLERTGALTAKKRKVALAVLRFAANHSAEMRRLGYEFTEIRVSALVNKGKVVDVGISLPRLPTDAEIQRGMREAVLG